jgi:hypothetical protein
VEEHMNLLLHKNSVGLVMSILNIEKSRMKKFKSLCST